MATKEEVRGVILNGPNRWSLVIDGLVNGKPVEFEVDAGDAPFKMEIRVNLLLRAQDVVSPDNDYWSIEARINNREMVCKNLGMEFKKDVGINFYARIYSTKEREGRFLVTYEEYNIKTT